MIIGFATQRNHFRRPLAVAAQRAVRESGEAGVSIACSGMIVSSIAGLLRSVLACGVLIVDIVGAPRAASLADAGPQAGGTAGPFQAGQGVRGWSKTAVSSRPVPRSSP
jgi:hypothetical protein